MNKIVSRSFCSSARKIVVCANGAVAAWHPPQEFPYEHTRSIELSASKEAAVESKLSQCVNQATRLAKGPNNAELKEIFYTDKNEWYTRSVAKCGCSDTKTEIVMRCSTVLGKSFNVVRLKTISYSEGLKQQQHYLNVVKQAKTEPLSKNFLLLLEHNPVYTVGIREKQYTSEEEEKLKLLGADFHRTTRGGLITFHGPGQLVAYPIFDLRRISPKPHGVRTMVNGLEQVLIDCAAKDFGIRDVGRTENTGVWVNRERKLAALGIAVSHGVSYHGVAINCNTDLTWFENITACGIEGVASTSLSKECAREVTVTETIPLIINRFAEVFQCQVEND